MANVANDLGALMDAEMWMDVAIVLVGFIAPVLLANTVDDVVDLPDEIYGIVVIAISNLAMDRRTKQSKMLTLGGGLYTLDQLLERVGLKDRVENFGAGGE